MTKEGWKDNINFRDMLPKNTFKFTNGEENMHNKKISFRRFISFY